MFVYARTSKSSVSAPRTRLARRTSFSPCSGTSSETHSPPFSPRSTSCDCAATTKYTEIGGTVRVAAHREGPWIELTVSDSGIGIAPAMLPLVFDLFAQEQQAVDRSLGGLGLGLAIVRSIVQLHGGSVSVKSEGLGKGSAFAIRLPAITSEAQVALPAPAATVEPVSAQQRPLRVLVVDDNEDAAEMLQMTLEALGYTVRTANDGPSALKVAAELVPDVALLDIGLPVMDGYELACRLRADPRHSGVRLIALTGYGQHDDMDKARDAGFDEHIVKPVDMKRLESAIKKHVVAPAPS